MPENLVHGPPDDARIIGIIAQERDARRDGPHLVRQRGADPGECPALAVSAAENACRISLRQGGGEIHGADHVAECTPVIKNFFG